MNVRVLSYQDFKQLIYAQGINDETVETYKKTIFISILDSEGWFAVNQFEKDHTNTITLQFDDVLNSGELSPTNRSGNTRAFETTDAKKILDLLDANPDAKNCIVHCAAGISRSGAVGQIVNDYYKGDYNVYRRNNPRIMPNQMVIQKLNRLIRES